MQILLNVVGNAVKFSKEGSVSISAVAAKSESLRDPRAPEFFLVQSENHFYLRVHVKDTGSGINPQDIPKLFCKFAENQALGSKSCGGTGLGLAISKRSASFVCPLQSRPIKFLLAVVAVQRNAKEKDIQMHKVVFEKDASRDGTALLFTFRNQVEQHNLEGTNPQQMIIIMPNSTYIRSAEQG
ncbi:ethylene receptor [Nicotiana attenuata]|uniref:histidine kinase n=1 Tax=Nicotiana attenuata TaxID=49451 RepID=A0A314LEV2_NICAT|nr:ethylene receptor [Nicotiana attenuata]